MLGHQSYEMTHILFGLYYANTSESSKFAVDFLSSLSLISCLYRL